MMWRLSAQGVGLEGSILVKGRGEELEGDEEPGGDTAGVLVSWRTRNAMSCDSWVGLGMECGGCLAAEEG